MGIESIQLFLNDKNVFYSGEAITGFAQVTCSAPTQIPCLKVRFEGYARVHWSETRSRTHRDSHGHTRTEHYTVHFSSGQDLVCLEQDVLVQGGMLPPGSHSLPFGFQIPPNLVTSFEGIHGYIRYWLEAKVPQGWFKSLFAPKGTASVKVIQPIDTNIPQYQFSVRGRDTKSICCCCCAQGPIEVEAGTDRAAYCPNEPLIITGSFANKSNRKVKPYAKLVQRVNYYAQGHHRQSSNSWTLPIANGITDGVFNTINEQGQATWNGTQFVMPAVPPSLQLPILQVSYYIEVGLDIPMAFDLSVYLPIVLGTIPYRGPSQAPVVTHQVIGTAPPNAGPASTYQMATPWQGTGHQQSGGPPASAPPLEYGFTGAKIEAPPPSYFESVLSSQQPALPADDQFTSRDQGAAGGAPPQIGFKQ